MTGALFLFSLTVLLGLALGVTACGIPQVSFIAEPLYRTPIGSTLRFDHNTDNDTEDFRGYELYYKIYNASSTALIDADREYIEGGDSPGTGRIVAKNFLRMVRTSDGSQTGTGQIDPPMIPVGSASKDDNFTVTIEFASGAQTAVVTNPGESASSVTFYRQNVLLQDQIPGVTPFDLYGEENDYQYDPQAASGNDEDLSRMLTSAFQATANYEVAVVVIAYGIDASNFQQIYSTPIYLGTVDLGI